MEFISIEAIPAWFAIFATLVYAAGFVIEFTFFNSMGIKESVSEIFKAKYIYIGLLCIQLPISMGVVIIGYFRIKRKGDQKNNARAYLPTVFLILNLLLAFYFLTAFCDPDFFRKNQVPIGALFSCMMIGLVFIREVQDWSQDGSRKLIVSQDPFHNLKKLSEENGVLFVPKRLAYWFLVISLNKISPKRWEHIRWGLFLTSAIMTGYILGPLKTLFWEMLQQGAWLSRRF